MRTTFALLCCVLVIFSACKSADNKPAQPANQTQQQVQKQETPPAAKPAGQGIKWPADYPITGDSVAVMTIEQGGKPLGEIVLEFYPDKAPNHVRNFKYLADTGYYDGTKFHRVMKGFMIQGGDPNSKGGDPNTWGMGGPGWTLNQEFNPTPHVKGILSMARTSDPNSAGSQFFICHGDPHSLDNQYTVFGNAIKGLDVVDKIANTPVGGPQGTAPNTPVVLKSCKIVPRSSVKI
jgi:peptidyl-prolyl cis-trans isomerase B (cyclophilin B)